MEKEFKEFCSAIKLTSTQREDAQKKYNGVCKKLHDNYYDCEYTGKTKFLFGSYKTHTNIRPLSEDQDVDVLFKIPEETYNKFKEYKGNGPAALLQEIRNVLKEKYTTTETIKAWGKIVLVKFSEGCHNIELLPAFELENGTFSIPNSENGGDWESFDPRHQIDTFETSNSNTNTLTGDLCRMMKSWIRNTASLNYKSYDLLNDVIDFCKYNYSTGSEYKNYHTVIKDFLDHIKYKYSDDKQSCIQTAYNRAIKAIEFMDNSKPKEASEEWRKIFGDKFPKVESNPQAQNETKIFSTPSSPWNP